jgi:hypothetical protein
LADEVVGGGIDQSCEVVVGVDNAQIIGDQKGDGVRDNQFVLLCGFFVEDDCLKDFESVLELLELVVVFILKVIVLLAQEGNGCGDAEDGAEEPGAAVEVGDESPELAYECEYLHHLLVEDLDFFVDVVIVFAVLVVLVLFA